jgi:hypothetical protein
MPTTQTRARLRPPPAAGVRGLAYASIVLLFAIRVTCAFAYFDTASFFGMNANRIFNDGLSGAGRRHSARGHRCQRDL